MSRGAEIHAFYYCMLRLLLKPVPLPRNVKRTFKWINKWINIYPLWNSGSSVFYISQISSSNNPIFLHFTRDTLNNILRHIFLFHCINSYKALNARRKGNMASRLTQSTCISFFVPFNIWFLDTKCKHWDQFCNCILFSEPKLSSGSCCDLVLRPRQ